MVVAAAVLVLAPFGPSAPPLPWSDPVRDGLEWLAGQQKSDGHWEGRNGLIPTTVTATAGLALMMEGSTLKAGRYAPHLRKALAWFEANTSEKGQLAGTAPTERAQYVPAHAQGLLFLACVYDSDDDDERRGRLAKLIARATTYLIEQQTERGGWGLVAPSATSSFDDTLGTTNALQALLAVRKAGLAVPKGATDKAFLYFAKSTSADGGVSYTLSPGMGGHTAQPFYSAVVAACAATTGERRPDQFAKWVQNAHATNTTQQTRFLSQGNAASGLLLLGPYTRVAYQLGDHGHRKLDPNVPEAGLLLWSTHRAKMYKTLRDAQGKDGSWPDNAYGPTYATALALIVLQLDNGYVPAFAR